MPPVLKEEFPLLLRAGRADTVRDGKDASWWSQFPSPVRSLKWMSLCVEDVLVQTNNVGSCKDEVKVFQRLGQPEAL